MRPHFLVFAGFSLALPTSIYAQQTPPSISPLAAPISDSEPTETLETLLRLAAQNTPQSQIARANLDAARARAWALRGLPNPTLQIVPGVGGDRESRDEEIIVSQSLDLFGVRRANRAVLDAQARRAESEIALSALALAREVKDAAAALFAAQEAENLGEFQLEIARKFRAAAARRAALGDVPAVQVQRADLELFRTENELETARAHRLERRAILNQLVGRAPQTPFRVALPISPVLAVENGPIPSSIPSSNTNDSLPVVANATGRASAPINADLPFNRPDLRGAQATLEARRAEVTALGRSRFPSVEIQARRGGVFDGASTSLRAVITVPLLDFGSLKNQKQAAQAEVRAQEAQIALLRAQTELQIENSRNRLRLQRGLSERYRLSIVPLALDLLRKSQIGYEQGASTLLEVLEAGRAARAVQTEYLQALVGVFRAEAALEATFGAGEAISISNPIGPTTPDGVAPPGTVPNDVFSTPQNP